MQANTPFFVAAVLTWSAGFVDAVGFLTLDHIYTANMSGNSVALGIHLASADWRTAAWRFWPVITYLAGLLFCRLLLEFGARRQIRPIASIALSCELALLTPVWLGRLSGSSGSNLAIIYIALLAGSMGIQNAALTKFSSMTLHTGFVTGTLLKTAEELARYLTWLWDHLRSRTQPVHAMLRVSFRQRSFRASVWLWSMWMAYVVGAVGGALGTRALSLRSLAVPMLSLCLIITIDLHRPLALDEERAQAEST